MPIIKCFRLPGFPLSFFYGREEKREEYRRSRRGGKQRNLSHRFHPPSQRIRLPKEYSSAAIVPVPVLFLSSLLSLFPSCPPLLLLPSPPPRPPFLPSPNRLYPNTTQYPTYYTIYLLNTIHLSTYSIRSCLSSPSLPIYILYIHR